MLILGVREVDFRIMKNVYKKKVRLKFKLLFIAHEAIGR